IIDRLSPVLPIPNSTTSPTILRSAAVGDGLQVTLDDDVRRLGRHAGIDFESGIPTHTGLAFFTSEARYLTSLASSIIAYPGSIEAIRANKDAHLAIVSGTLDGDFPSLFTTYDGVAANTLSIGTAYIHISYSCWAVDELRHRWWAAGHLIPLIIYLTPIR